MLRIRLFGIGQAKYHDQILDGFPNHSPCLLLCYLLLNKHRMHYREQLAAVFWGDQPAPIARRNLRNTLWRLNQKFETVGVKNEQYILIDDEYITFVTTSPYWLDVDYFEDINSKYADSNGEDLSQDQAGELSKAVEIYKGDLLVSVYDDWCLHERERLRLAYLNALSKLMAFHSSQGNYEQGIQYGDRILELDRIREKTHRQLMILYWLSGNYSAALAQYKRFRQILQEEIGVEPMEETQLLYKQMVHNQFSPGSISKSKPNKDSSIRPPATVVESALSRLYAMHEMVERISSEIHDLEGLLQQALNKR